MVKAMVPKHEMRKYIVNWVAVFSTTGIVGGRVMYAAPGGGGTPVKSEAQIFLSRQQAMEVAEQIAVLVRERAAVSIEEVTS